MKKEEELTNDPAQSSFDRTDALVEIVTVQAHSSFESKGVSRTETCELNGLGGGDESGDVDGVGRGDGDLIKKGG